MEVIRDNGFEQFEKQGRRRDLLPLWIKIFCWLFMVMGAAAIGCLIYGLFTNEASLSLYGFETNQPISLLGLAISGTMIFKGYAAYALWFERDEAIVIGKIDAVIGTIISIVSMVVLPFITEDNKIHIRLEILLLIPYYMKLDKIKDKWAQLRE